MARWLGLGLVVAVLAACGGDDAPAPPEIQYGLEECGFCRMIVSEEKHASALVDGAGTAIAFDDPGCLAAYLDGHQMELHALYFRDHENDRWLSQSEAGFVPVDDSPMGYGIAAVPRDTPRARDWEWAQVRALDPTRRGLGQ